jgi:hypothetical protein
MRNPLALFVNRSGRYAVDTRHYSGVHTGKQNIHGSLKTPGSGQCKKADPGARDMIYSESDTGSVWLFRQAF